MRFRESEDGLRKRNTMEVSLGGSGQGETGKGYDMLSTGQKTK